MKPFLIRLLIAASLVITTDFLIPNASAAGYVFNAAKRGFAANIAKNGFRREAMKREARFGKKAYFADTIKTARMEKPAVNSVLRFKKGKAFQKRVMDTRKMSTNEMKSVSGLKDMRGTVKHGVIGPKLGHRLGAVADREHKIINYRSAKDPRGTNYAIPAADANRKSIINLDGIRYLH